MRDVALVRVGDVDRPDVCRNRRSGWTRRCRRGAGWASAAWLPPHAERWPDRWSAAPWASSSSRSICGKQLSLQTTHSSSHSRADAQKLREEPAALSAPLVVPEVRLQRQPGQAERDLLQTVALSSSSVSTVRSPTMGQFSVRVGSVSVESTNGGPPKAAVSFSPGSS